MTLAPDFGDASPCSRASWPVLVISDVLVSEIITFPFSISWIFYTFVANFTYSTQGVAKVYPRYTQGVAKVKRLTLPWEDTEYCLDRVWVERRKKSVGNN